MNKYSWRKKHNEKKLTASGRIAKRLVCKICRHLTDVSSRVFYPYMYCDSNVYECHIIDAGHCVELENGDVQLSNNPSDEKIGSIFFGGHYDRRKFKDAESKAWQSLLADCIGRSDDEEIRDFHNLTRALKTFGPEIDFNFDTVEQLEAWLNSRR